MFELTQRIDHRLGELDAIARQVRQERELRAPTTGQTTVAGASTSAAMRPTAPIGVSAPRPSRDPRPATSLTRRSETPCPDGATRANAA